MSRTGSMRSTQKIVLSLLVVCFLVLGLLVAMLLVRQQQDVRSDAAAVPGVISVLDHNGVGIDVGMGIAIGGNVVDIQKDYIKVADAKGVVYTLLMDQANPAVLLLDGTTDLAVQQDWVYYDSMSLKSVLSLNSRVVAFIKNDSERATKYQTVVTSANPVVGTVDRVVLVK